jgi:threonine/homoserine/homoserine lactone efflux protein
MSYDLISALALFAFVSSITPGPNNLMLMASGANFGLRRSVPHMLGVAIGFVVMVLLMGIGLAQIFQTWPVANQALKVISILYLLYLAWRIATAAPPEGATDPGRPFSFLQAAGFQWVNPKAWAMALTAITAYSPANNWTAILLVAMLFGLINLPSVGIWVLLGEQMSRLLTSRSRLVAFNWTMSGLLIASLYPIIWS